MRASPLRGRASSNTATAALAGGSLSIRRFEPRMALALGGLICLLIAEGVAITQSYLWAAPLLCLLLVFLASDLPVAPFLGITLLVRVLTDNLASTTSRHSASVNLSVFIAALLILVAVGLLLRRRQAIGPTVLVALWLCIWTAIAVRAHGTSTVTIREGVREASILAVLVVVCNCRPRLSVRVVTQLIQVAGVVSALLALYQLATHSGQLVAGEIRSNGTFAQPNGAAVFFAIATVASVWRYINAGHRRLDLFFAVLYAVATISTFSLGGLSCLIVMLLLLGVLRTGSFRLKLGSCVAVVAIIVGFLATPLGAERIAAESSSNFSTAHLHGARKTSLAWRFYKWETLLPEWERAPLFGQGLGATITSEGNSQNGTAGIPPHSELVRYLVETGAVGFIGLLVGIIVLLRRLRRRFAVPETREAGALGIAVVLGLLINGVAANTLLYTPAAYAAAAIVAAVLVAPTNEGKAASG